MRKKFPGNKSVDEKIFIKINLVNSSTFNFSFMKNIFFRNHFVSKEVVKNLHAATKHLDVELQKLNQQIEVTTVLNLVS